MTVDKVVYATLGRVKEKCKVIWECRETGRNHHLVVRVRRPRGAQGFVIINESGKPGEPLYLPDQTIVLVRKEDLVPEE